MDIDNEAENCNCSCFYDKFYFHVIKISYMIQELNSYCNEIDVRQIIRKYPDVSQPMRDILDNKE